MAGRPTACAFKIRKASEKRARLNSVVTATTSQKAPPSFRNSAICSGKRAGFSGRVAMGSRTPIASTSTASAAGIVAAQNTVRMSSTVSHISSTATAGPRKAPTVSSD